MNQDKQDLTLLLVTLGLILIGGLGVFISMWLEQMEARLNNWMVQILKELKSK